MREDSSKFQRFSVLALFVILSGCAAKPTLEAKSAGVPVGVDLSGYWAVRPDSNADQIAVPGDRGDTAILVPRSDRYSRSRKPRGPSGSAAHVFLEYGRDLKISQTFFGMFISYDRSIVEEYSFGENRIVKIGPIEALRVSGWEGQSFVVETLDDSGTTLFESWSLMEGGEVLVRDILISRNEKDLFTHRQFFDRRQEED